MGNTVRAGVTWSRCGAVVSLSPSLQEYTIIHPALIIDRFIHRTAPNTTSLCYALCIMYIGPPTGGKQGESIITQLRGGKLWRQNLLILRKFLNPNVGKEIPVILERNC